MNNAIGEMKVLSAITPTAGVAGTTAINSTTIDTQGFENIAFIIRLGAITASAVTSIKLQQDNAAGMGTAQDVKSSLVTVADTDDDKIVILEIVKPIKRYVRAVVSRGTANAVIASAEAILFNGRNLPVTQDAATLKKQLISPEDGTA